MTYLARIGLYAAAILLALACATAEAARKPKELLQYIPADTPYVMAFTESLPDELLDKVEPALDRALTAYRQAFEVMIADAAAKMAEEEGGAEQAERFEAFMGEIMAVMSAQGLEDVGLGRDALFALYGDGLLPVMRLALSDGDRFAAMIARLEAAAGEEFLVADLGGMQYRYFDVDDKVRLIVATPGDDAIITVVPVAYGDDRLRRTLGIDKPDQNLARSKELHKIARQYDLTDHFVSYVDVERLAASFLGDPTGLNAELLSLLDYDAAQLDDACRTEFGELAAIAPRLVMGYTEVNAQHIDSALIIELRDDLAAGLALLPAAVPGLGPDLGGLFSFGFSLNPLALREFYEARLDAMEDDPFECTLLADMQAGTAKGRELLAQPVPPVVYNFRGFLAKVRDVTGWDIAGNQPPESIDGALLLAIENAQDVVNMAALMDPQIAAMNLLPDGKARKLDLPQLGEMAAQAYAALAGGALSVALGNDAEHEVEAMLVADAPGSSPLMSFSMDAKRYYNFIGESVMRAEESEDEEPMPPELRAAVRDVVVSAGEVYDRLSMNVYLTKRGVEIGSRVTLAD